MITRHHSPSGRDVEYEQVCRLRYHTIETKPELQRTLLFENISQGKCKCSIALQVDRTPVKCWSDYFDAENNSLSDLITYIRIAVLPFTEQK